MISNFITLGLALMPSNYTIYENTSNVYDIGYHWTLDNNFLTHQDEFNLELYDILGLNAFEFHLGDITYETISSWQDFEYYYSSSCIITSELDEELYSYNATSYCDSYSAQQWLTINIGGACYIDTREIDNYLNATISFRFRFYCNGADTLRKTPLSENASAFAFHYDDGGVYRNGYRIGYDDGVSVGYDDGVADSASLYQMIVAIPDRFIQSFQTIFNFEVFGVNIFNFIVSIISIGLIIWLIRKVSGN